VSDLAPTYKVLVDGTELGQDDLNRLKEIRIANYLRLPDICTISAAYPDADALDNSPFKVASSLEVKVGPSGDPHDTPKTVFWGTVATLEPGFGAGGIALSIRAFDRAHALMNGRKSRAFQNVTLTDIFSKLVGEAGLTADASGASVVHEYVQQDNETDWDFLWRLADREGLEFVAEDKKAILRKPGAGDTVDLEWPDTLREFTPRLTSVQQAESVTVRGWDRKTKQPLVGNAASPSSNGGIGVVRGQVNPSGTVFVATEAVKEQDEATSLAQAVLDKVSLAYATAEGVALGNPDIKAGCSVNVSGIGNKFGGTYRVGHVEHILKAAGFETHFGNSPPTVLGTIGGGNGSGPPPWPTQLVVGVVTNNNDPDGHGRVRVKYPSLDFAMEGAWARVALPHAGAGGRGAAMIPQVDDEVLIGFLNGDSRVPYVIGSVFNGVDKPDGDMLQDIDKQDSFVVNTFGRAIVKSKGDMILTTSGGSRAASGADDGKLTITVQDEVKQTSKQDWTVDTQGGASHSASKNYEIKATQNFNASGMSVSIKANQSVSIEGTAGVELKCGGSSVKVDMSGVTISGPLIRIG
jgi:uncharacterized protein involved in type VI secretion and phage assembly